MTAFEISALGIGLMIVGAQTIETNWRYSVQMTISGLFLFGVGLLYAIAFAVGWLS